MTNQQWLRYVSLRVGTLLITTDQLDIEFEVKGGNSSTANTADITVFNLSKKSRSAITADQEILLRAGYTKDIGDLFSGIVKSTSETRDQGDIAYKISAITRGYSTNAPVKKYPVSTPLKSIVEAAFKDSSIPALCLDGCQGLALDAEYTSDPDAAKNLEYCQKYVNGNITALQKVKKSFTSVKYYIEAAGGYFVPEDYVRGSEVVVLSSETGLDATTPETPDDGSYTRTIRCGLNHRIGTDTLVKLESLDSGACGTYKVVEYAHKYEGSDFSTECKVRPA